MLKDIYNRSNQLTNLLVLVTLFIIIGVSLTTNITKPRLWVDEGKTIELARNYLNYKTLDIQVAPGEFSNIAPVLQSTGYPVSIPLALFFKIFGLGPHQARIFMLIWLTATLYATFFIATKIFGHKEALFSFLLIASFASFYDNGRTVVGEIPGFLMLLTGLYFWLKKEDHLTCGLVWGLSVVTKPSVFLIIIPTIVLTILEKNIESVKKLSQIALGMMPAAALWFMVVIKDSLPTAITAITTFYRNPYSSDISTNIIRNIKALPFSITIIYFSGLFITILISRYLTSAKDNISRLYNFIIIYTIFAFIYYLRSPGWLRYIVIAELLILFVLPDAIWKIIEKIQNIKSENKQAAWVMILVTLITIQTIQIFTLAHIYYSDNVPKIISYINSEHPDSSVGTIGVIEAGAFFNTNKRYTMLDLTGMPRIGADMLEGDNRPEIVVVNSSTLTDSSINKIIDEKYRLVTSIERYNIYKLKGLK